jgi:biopolymer transport protein ExbD
VDGQTDKPPEKSDLRNVEISADGKYALKGHIMALAPLLRELEQDFKLNPNIVVYIRADENSRTKELAALISGCQQAKITRYSLRTQPPARR